MGRRGISRSASRRGPKNQVWTAVLMNEQIFDEAPAIEFNIVEPLDWSTANSFERATLLRIRGWIAFDKAVSSAHSTVFAMIYKTDADDPVRAPDVVAEYTDEDVLWSGGFTAQATGATPDGVGTQGMIIDIKAMRKITVSDEIRVSVVGTAAGIAWSLSGVLRGLVRLGGN